MPIYEYTCENCEKTFDKLVSASSAKPSCPECGSRKVRRLFSTFAAHGGGSSQKCPSASSCPMSESSGGCCGCPGAGLH